MRRRSGRRAPCRSCFAAGLPDAHGAQSRGWPPAYAARAGSRMTVAAATEGPGPRRLQVLAAADRADRRTRLQAPMPFSRSALGSSDRRTPMNRCGPAPCVPEESRPPGHGRHRRFEVLQVALPDWPTAVEAPALRDPARVRTAQSQPPGSTRSRLGKGQSQQLTTRVAAAESIKRVAKRIVATKQLGHDVVVVISAMGDTTDELMGLALEVSPLPPPRELDMLLTAGERMSAALLAMAIHDQGMRARSLTGSQAGIITTGTHGNARIIDITPGRITSALDGNDIVIVAGFQGVAQDTKDVTTLGRGASDTTAVALAAALGADHCEIYTDVDGVFTADPRIVPSARRIPEISYEEMMEMAACGAKILHLRCVEYARRENVRVHVRSSFSDKDGTWVQEPREGGVMEQAIISGVVHDRSEAKITIVGVPDRVGEAARIFTAVAAAEINIDMIVQNVSAVETSRTDISFTLPKADGQTAMETLDALKADVGFTDVLYDDQIGKISVIGVGMRSHPGVSAKFFSALAGVGVNIEMISTSEIRISVIVDQDDVDRAVVAAHTALGLDAAEEAVVYAGTGRWASCGRGAH